MPMSPEIFTSLERFSARRTREWSVGRVDPLMKPNGRRVFEAFTAMPTLALVQVAMPIQIVFLEMDTQLEPHVTLLASVWPPLSVTEK